MKGYVRLLRHPGAAALLAAALVGRFPLGMVPLGIVLTARSGGGSYALAGLLSGAHALGSGVSAPLLGRLADRYGQIRVLVPCGVAYATLLSLLVAAIGRQAAPPLLVALAAGAGLSFPPLSACARATWSATLSDRPALKESAYALDSVIVELAFVSGPLLVAALQAVATAGTALVAAGGFAVTGTLAFSAVPAARAVRVVDAPRLRGGALRAAGVRTVMVAFALLAVGFGVLEVAIPAFTEQRGAPGAAGFLLSLIAAGSLLGGLTYGARHWRGALPRRYLALLGAFAAGMTLVVLPTTILTMGVTLFAAGLALAPTVISAFRLIDELAPAGTRTEAFTWVQSAIVGGTAAGTAVTGAAVDLAGVRPALGLAGAAVLAAVAAAWAGRAALHPAATATGAAPPCG